MTLRLIFKGSRQVDPEGGYVNTWHSIDLPVPEAEAEKIRKMLNESGLQGVEIAGEVQR